MKKKKIVLKAVLVLIICLFGVKNVFAATNPYKPTSRFGTNCTWFAWDQVYKKLGIALPGWGNANTWYDYAKKAGFEVGSTPKDNSIAVWKWDAYGHVAYVEKAVGDKIYIWDSNVCYDYKYSNKEEYDACIQNGVSEETDKACWDKYVTLVPKACEYSASYWQTPGDLIGYIYLDKVPTKKTSTSSSATTTKKSSNAYLSGVKITNIDFEFKKDTLEYSLVVDSDIESIQIDATTEHKKAKVEGTGEHKLNIGDNTIKLVVTAEDSTKKTYVFQIKKKDNNTSLSSLTISNVDFTFEKDILEYEITIQRDIESVLIDGVAESSSAKIDGLGEYAIKDEETLITVKVTAEDENEKEYKVTIKKEPLAEETKETEKKNNIWIILAATIAPVIVIIAIVLFYIFRKKDNIKGKK